MHLPTRRFAAVVAALAIRLTACGSAAPRLSAGTASTLPGASPAGSASFLPVPVSSELAVGNNRVVFGLLDPSGQKSAAAPDRTLTIAYRGPNGESIPAAPATFIWAQENVKGVYVGQANFASAGKWVADFTSAAPGQAPATVSFSFDVKDHTSVLAPGDAAPSVKTPTLADVGGDVAKISTDQNPVKRFYETSEADALAAKKPFVLLFATPKFCQQAVCGPTLDKLKPIAAAHPEMTFINVEPYELQFKDGSLQPVLTNGQLTPVEATVAFKLQTEPYLFVVGADGKVSSSFELVFSPEELNAAIKAVEAG
ncbi:MAG TPA: hypothetical protein VIK65_14240 [Candidatus Limnocylindrales bacterium]